MNFAAARRFSGIAREDDPDPAAGARERRAVAICGIGAMPHLANSSGDSASFSSLICQLPPRNIATSPAMAAADSCL